MVPKFDVPNGLKAHPVLTGQCAWACPTGHRAISDDSTGRGLRWDFGSKESTRTRCSPGVKPTLEGAEATGFGSATSRKLAGSPIPGMHTRSFPGSEVTAS